MFKLFKKKRLTRDAFIARLLDLQQEMVSVLSSLSVKQLAPTIDENTLKLECEVLSLWILSLAIPDDTLKDDIHNQYCSSRDFDSEFTNKFLTFVSKRYECYFEGYNIWVKDHKAGAMLGSAILSVFKGEADSGKLQLNAFSTLNAFSLVMETFKATLQSIGDMKKRYDLSEIANAI